MVDLLSCFPIGVRNPGGKEDKNPAIQLFGRRFFGDQPPLEILSEFMLVMTSNKYIGNMQVDSLFPDMECLNAWSHSGGELIYEPKAKLNLKLFTFLGSSRLETRHELHRKHCVTLWDDLKLKIDSGEMEKDEALHTLSNLLLGFWGNGSERTWCAQTFLPFCKSVLTSEAIWKKSKSISTSDWEGALNHFQYSQHLIFARSGEMIYLHLCNALRQDPAILKEWFSSHTTDGQTLDELLTENEKDPNKLLNALQAGFKGFFGQTPAALGKLVDFIDTGVDPVTAQTSDEMNGSPRQASCGWCPVESWCEGYLLAVELTRILTANIDLIETVDVLETACAMHVMRTLVAQSYRATSAAFSYGFSYRILVSDIEGTNRRIKELSRESLSQVNSKIYTAIRIPKIMETLDQGNLSKIYSEADNRYGRKLYLRLGKALGLIIPRRGAGIRVVMTDRILRYLLISLMPGQRMTYDTFKRQIELHHGLVFDEGALCKSRDMEGRNELYNSNDQSDIHLIQMLDAAGVLVRLSDSCSLVRNPFWRGTQT